MSITIFNIGLSRLSRNLENRHKTALGILSGFEGRIITEDDIAREEGGRPYFKGKGNREQGTDFNISHSGNMVAVSYVRGEGLRTGCDIQIVKERVNTMRIAEQFFSKNEQDYIKQDRNRFFKIWALKECYIKLHGLSVFDMGKAPDFADKDRNMILKQNNISFYLYELHGRNDGKQYVLTAAVTGEETIPSIQWFGDNEAIDIIMLNVNNDVWMY